MKKLADTSAFPTTGTKGAEGGITKRLYIATKLASNINILGMGESQIKSMIRSVYKVTDELLAQEDVFIQEAEGSSKSVSI